MHGSASVFMSSHSPRRIPAYLPLMTAITGVYLTVEVPFAAHLLDVLGGSPTTDDIHSIEKFGRVLTGCAVAIALMGWVFARGHAKRVAWSALPLYNQLRTKQPRFAKTAVGAVLAGGLAVGVTYVALDRIAAAIGDYSTGEARRAAFQSVLAKSAIASGRIADPSLKTIDAASVPAWKAFVSVAPSFDVKGGLLALAGVEPERLRQDEADRRLGTWKEFRTVFLGKGLDPARQAWEKYKAGSKRYFDARERIETRINSDWEEYWGQLRQQGYDRRIPSAYVAQQIRDNVRRRGIPVAASWHPHDRSGFEAAHRRSLLEPVEAEYRRGFEEFLGKGAIIQPGLKSFTGFLSQPPVQRKIRDDAGLPAGQVLILPMMSDKNFKEAVYEPKRAAILTELGDMYEAPPHQFSAGGRYDEEGRQAAQMASIPALALTLSLAGALLHICKVSGFVGQMIGHGANVPALKTTKAKWGMGIAVAGIMAGVMILSGNAVTSSDGYAKLAADGGLATPILTGSIAMQPKFQPLGHALGKVGGWQFVSGRVPAPRHLEGLADVADDTPKTADASTD